MEKQENEITIGQLFGIVKKSLKRGLLYILITAIVLTSVMLTVKAFTETKVYTTTVSFTDADENILSKLNAQKTNVITNALKSANKNDANLNEKILSNLSIAAKDTDADNKEYIPNTFVITLKADSDIDFTKDEYKNVLDNIAEEYKKKFTKNDMQTYLLIYSSANLDSDEYLEQTIDLSEIITDFQAKIKDDLNDFDDLESFVSNDNNKRVKDISSVLTTANTSLNTLKNTIVLNKIEKSDGSLSRYITLCKTTYTNEETAKKSYLEELNNSLEKYSNVIKTVTSNDSGGSTMYVYNDENFIKLVNEKNQVAKELSEITKKKNMFENFETTTTTTTTTDEIKSTIVESIKTIFNTIESSITDYNTLAKDYNNMQTGTSQLTRVESAHTTIENAIGTKTILLIVVAACFIAYIVAFSQTFAKQKSNGYFNK